MRLPTMFVATISNVQLYISKRERLFITLTFTCGNEFKQSCIIRDSKHIEQICNWTNVDSFYCLTHKKLGIKVHEDFGFITDILAEDFSDIFALCE